VIKHEKERKDVSLSTRGGITKGKRVAERRKKEYNKETEGNVKKNRTRQKNQVKGEGDGGSSIGPWGVVKGSKACKLGMKSGVNRK